MFVRLALICLVVAVPLEAAPTVRIRLPERFRLLVGQQFDLRVETAQLMDGNASLSIQAAGPTGSLTLSSPEITTDNDADPSNLDKAWTYRKLSFPGPGVWTLTVTVTDGDATVKAAARVAVQQFQFTGDKRSIILFLGDAMGTSYRDAGRIVAKSTHNHLREGFFDELQQMDTLPVSGMVMTYAMDRIVPDSANTATAWSTGNKTIDGALGVFPDNNDFRFNPSDAEGTKQYALDNPRVETLWEYLKRLYGYKTGIVSTAEITDATPAGEGGHTITRTLGYEIARQYVDGVFTSGPTFDVILGGGQERFESRTPANSGDHRNLADDLKRMGYRYVKNRSELQEPSSANGIPDRLLGLFRTGNMNVAYDMVGLSRPPDEPAPDFAGFDDQPYLDEMTDQALAVLSKNCSPFILMVEGASIDKQSHSNNSAGTIWDTIEFDKAVGVGRRFAGSLGCANRSVGNQSSPSRPLVLVTADHDQSMLILGVSDTSVTGAVPNTRSNSPYPVNAEPPPSMAMGSNPGEVDGFPDYEDGNGDGYPENANRFRLAVGFRTSGHTSSSVPITAEGPGALLFTGYYDQTDIFFKMARAISGDTSRYDEAVRAMKSVIVGQNY